MTNDQRMTNHQCQIPNIRAMGDQSPSVEASVVSGTTPVLRRSRFEPAMKCARSVWSLAIGHSLVIGHWTLVISVLAGLGYFLAADRSSGGNAIESPKQKLVKVLTKKEGDITHFFVDNREADDVTATFTIAPDNLEADVKFPYTSTYPPGEVTEAFTLTPIDPHKGWGYSYTNHYTIGSFRAVHDDSAIYLLPYAAGGGFRVTQGYNGAYSHTGPDQYALDFKMPAGTPVHAARGGVVVKVKDDSGSGGPSRKFESCANYILIRHDDDTLSNYAHLQKHGSRVKLGDRVAAGDWIALSGNTGFTSGPHLHFSVFKTREDGGGRESIPVKFKTGDAVGITLVEGHSYKPFSPTATTAAARLAVHEESKGQSVGAPPRN